VEGGDGERDSRRFLDLAFTDAEMSVGPGTDLTEPPALDSELDDEDDEEDEELESESESESFSTTIRAGTGADRITWGDSSSDDDEDEDEAEEDAARRFRFLFRFLAGVVATLAGGISRQARGLKYF
jgi:hypothetical protein